MKPNLWVKKNNNRWKGFIERIRLKKTIHNIWCISSTVTLHFLTCLHGFLPKVQACELSVPKCNWLIKKKYLHISGTEGVAMPIEVAKTEDFYRYREKLYFIWSTTSYKINIFDSIRMLYYLKLVRCKIAVCFRTQHHSSYLFPDKVTLHWILHVL